MPLQLNGLDKILYISYDGMTDPLGQSQVIPYLSGLSQNGYQITILSVEKKGKLSENGEYISKLLSSFGIKWEYNLFTQNPPLLSKFYDLERLKWKALALQKKNKYRLIHCRSYVAAQVGLMLKKKFGVKFLFDMRGFWVDERVDGGLWDLKKPIYRALYSRYKKKEKDFIKGAEAIISLTQAGKDEIMSWPTYKGQPIAVIPCSADFDLFTLTNDTEKKKSREKLGLAPENYVVSYLGSLGTWYLIDEMLDFFSVVKKNIASAKFLFITRDDFEHVKQKALNKNINENDLVFTSASREEVALYAKASDVSLSFIKPCYSKIASSPTKLGELWAMGIPVISNSGVGDVKLLTQETGAGYVITSFTEKAMEEALLVVRNIKVTPDEIRTNAFGYYDLNKMQQRYSQVYKDLLF